MINLEKTLRGEDLFDKLQKEEPKDSKIIKIEFSKGLEYIVEKYKEIVKYDKKFGEHLTLKELYKRISTHLGDRLVTAQDIADFSIIMSKYFKDDKFFNDVLTGLSLSALINLSPEQFFTIYTIHFNRRISYLGYANEKNVIIIGDVDLLGEGMKKNVIKVSGSAWDVGAGMYEGAIYIEGEIVKIANNIIGGKVYHKGKLIVKEGRRIE